MGEARENTGEPLRRLSQKSNTREKESSDGAEIILELKF